MFSLLHCAATFEWFLTISKSKPVLNVHICCVSSVLLKLTLPPGGSVNNVQISVRFGHSHLSSVVDFTNSSGRRVAIT